MIRANDNLAILSAEAPINSPLMTDGAAFVQLEEEFRQAFEMTVIDLPRNMLINFPHLLGRCERRRSGHGNDAGLGARHDPHPVLAQDQCAHAQAIVVANKVQPGSPRSARPISKPRSNARSRSPCLTTSRQRPTRAKLGQTFADANRSAKAGVAMRDIANGRCSVAGWREDRRRPTV
jgi:pilus assembly protein CpaE